MPTDIVELEVEEQKKQELPEPPEPGLGDVLSEQAEKRDQPEKVDKKVSETKKDDKTAVTPVGDVIDAALAKSSEKKIEPEPVKDPTDQFKDVTEGVKSEKVKQNMVNMRTLIGDQFKTISEKEKAISDLQKQIETSKATPPDLQRQYDELKGKYEKEHEALTATNYELTDEYQKEFVEGYRTKVDKLANRVKAYGGNTDAVVRALSFPVGKLRDDAVQEVIADLSDTAKAKIGTLLTEIDDLDERRFDHRLNPSEAWERVKRNESERIQKESAQIEQERKTAFEQIVSKIPDKFPLLREVDPSLNGGTEWNGAVKQARESAWALFSPNATFDDLVETAIKGKDYDRVSKMYLDLRASHKETAQKLAEYEKSTPGMRGSKTPTPKDTEESEEDLPLGEALQRKAEARESVD